MTENVASGAAQEPGAQAAPPPETAPATTTTSPAPKTFTEAELQAREQEAKNAGYREAQSHYDRTTAQERTQNQRRQAARQAAMQQAASQRGGLQPADLQAIEESATVFEHATAYRELMAQQEQINVWQNHVHQAARAAGLNPGDPRLAGAVSADDLAGKIARAVREDARAEVEAAKTAAADAEKRKLTAHVESGALDALGGAASGSPGLRSEYDKERAALKRGDIMGLTKLNQKYRKRGLGV